MITSLLVLGGVGAWWAWGFVSPGPTDRGWVAYQRADWKTAVKLAKQRLQSAPDDHKALRLLGRASVRLGRFAEAREIYARLGTRDLEADDFDLLGHALIRAGQFESAERAWLSALDADPDRGETLFHLAQLALARTQTVTGARAAQRLARQPGWEARGDLLLGMIRASDHDPVAAAHALRRALSCDPKVRLESLPQFAAQELLARTLLQTRHPNEALEVLKAIPANGPNREAAWLLSRAHLQAGSPAEAMAALGLAETYRAEHPTEHEPSHYVGESECATCHREIYRRTLASRHARTLLRGPDLSQLSLPDRPVSDPVDPKASHTLKRIGNQVQFETRVDSKIFRAVVDYALGAPDRYTSLIGRDEQGRPRTLRLSSYHDANQAGWDGTKNLSARPARPEDFLGETFDSAEGTSECLTCHATTARSVREGSGPEALDKAIGCERCHGPGGLHLAAIASRFPDPAIATPAGTPAAGINSVCGSCHSQHFLDMPASRTDPKWARFPGSTLPWSRCYTESGGALNCVTCHDPHRDAETSPAYYEAKCLSCHVTATMAANAHTIQADGAFRRPCPISPTRDCLQCHMPKVRYQQMHIDFTDHYIRSPGTKNQAWR
jgi:tetratricopeptide (TPR) repeat protein